MTRGYVSFLYMYIFLIYFISKKQNYNNRKTKTKNTKIYRHEEDKSLPILFDYVIQETKFFFVRLVLNLNQYPFVPFTIKRRELSRFSLYIYFLISFFFLLF